ncbi:pentatricopeptide repeat-containing protein At5g40410, mitochondrial-like [Cornus florida]|uniref:pentatricopeptide repeat-containing protein At5g40410, mitochondrial-like n=1 Tax=Cornus florida TaxID=4283 RepID=UPI0028A0EB54|nr:pentatricopeptide repeat-containing protein At5g40410, mitochondrial-like [Cornus florida]
MITLPSSSSSLSLHLLSYFCLNSRNLTHKRKHFSLLHYNFIISRRLRNAFLSQHCLQFHSASYTEPIVGPLFLAISSCSSLSFCRILHARVIKSLNYSDGFIGDRLVSVYVKFGSLDDAQSLFDEMPSKDLVSWNSLISGFSRRGVVGKSLIALCRMRSVMGMQPNEVTFISIISACTEKGALDEGNYIHGLAVKMGFLLEIKVVNALINMYGKSGYLNLAWRLFEAMPTPNLVSWNSIVAINIQNGFSDEGIGHFKLMRRAGINPDKATLVTLLQGCADFGVGKLTDAIHGFVISCGLNADISIGTALLGIYAKSGRLYASQEVFEEMKSPDSIAWTAMLAAYAVHGHGRDAIDLFDLMIKKGVEPDHVTFTHLLSACSHSGLVAEAKAYFKIMSTVYGVEPRLDHYSCMVDLLGRAGHLKDARVLIESMPMEPNSGVWGALLNACRVYGNIEIGEEVAERLFALDPSDARNYIMLSNMYSAVGQWRNASNVRALMKERGLRRNPGCSFIEHGNKIHSFVVGDQSHPDSEKIYVKLHEVIEKIRKAGYVPKTEFVLHDVEEEVKQDMINKHSEKLAIAFGLLMIEAGRPLIITKNLRICGDCHNTAKFVSLVEKRTIIIRDPKRFHHFADGSCSCGDFW